jgi:predicted Zn-dependent peptidase
MRFNASHLFLAFAIILISACGDEQKTEEPTFVDPIRAEMHTLDNGLKVYFSVNNDKPRVQTFIAVNTGSTNDPADVTGLAHYLEHMVFKGTSNFATLDWEKEKPLLDHISTLYEEHKAESDPEKKKAIYAKIDSVSGEAAKFTIPNEYDKMISGLGAQGTNAFTSNERTAYINDIPSTELEKWMKVESERFSELVLRLFHTELEAVFEEFNRSQDSDYRKSWYAMSELLFPTHPYGQQTTIGEGDHLKNPSMVKIHEYFDTYYVPNNMAICLAGDFEPAKALELIKKYFGSMASKEVVQPTHPVEEPITTVKDTTVYGPMAEWVSVGYRLGGYHTADDDMLEMVSYILSNDVAGIIDLELGQKQKVIDPYAYSDIMRDYSTLTLGGNPKQDQSLEEVRDLLLAQVETLKKGEFSDELVTSVVRNMKVEQLNQFENNWLRAYLMGDAFIMGTDWNEYITKTERLTKISKEEIVDWANRNFNQNYGVVYKRTGVDSSTVKVDKPQITPIEINREVQSPFYKELQVMESIRLTPDFVDFDKSLGQKELMPGVRFFQVGNTTNDLFKVFIELDDDLKINPKVKMAMKYLDYLGTDEYSNEELRTKMYALGVNFNTRSSSRKVYLQLSGLEESFIEGLELMEHVIRNVQPDEEALANLKSDIQQEREDIKKEKGKIMQGISNYAKYGEDNRFNLQLSTEELEAVTAQELVDLIHSFTDYSHNIMYYGKSSMDDVIAVLKTNHPLPEKLKSVESPSEFPELEMDKNLVYFVDYDMVQTEMSLVSKGGIYAPKDAAYHSMFNEFFGSGLSSIIFQEIRESKALAYSAYSYIGTPNKADESHYVNAYIGTQNNKLGQAIGAMKELMNKIPEGTDAMFEESRISSLKQIESSRSTKDRIFWKYRSLEDRGLDYDISKNIYSDLRNMTTADMIRYFDSNIAGRKYVYCVIGKKSEMDMAVLNSLGVVQELSLEEIFGF